MSIWCWWCCHPFEGEPLNYPYKYEEAKRTFHTMGYFCSWSCMKKYNIDQGGPRMGERQMFITMMRREVYGKIIPCPIAMSREALSVFGGKLSIEEFRDCRKDLCEVKMPYSVFHSCIASEDTFSPVQAPQSSSSAASKLQTIRESVQVGEQLKLRRSKPLKRAESALEKSLKLKKKDAA